MKWWQIVIATAVFFGGMAFAPSVGFTSDTFDWQRYAPVGRPAPSLDISEREGAPDSFFALAGANFPAHQQAQIVVNGREIGSVPTGPHGEFSFTLATASAETGLYYVSAGTPSSAGATVSFLLDSRAPEHRPEASAALLQVPPGSAIVIAQTVDNKQ